MYQDPRPHYNYSPPEPRIQVRRSQAHIYTHTSCVYEHPGSANGGVVLGVSQAVRVQLGYDWWETFVFVGHTKGYEGVIQEGVAE